MGIPDLRRYPFEGDGVTLPTATSVYV